MDDAGPLSEPPLGDVAGAPVAAVLLLVAPLADVSAAVDALVVVADAGTADVGAVEAGAVGADVGSPAVEREMLTPFRAHTVCAYAAAAANRFLVSGGPKPNGPCGAPRKDASREGGLPARSSGFGQLCDTRPWSPLMYAWFRQMQA